MVYCHENVWLVRTSSKIFTKSSEQICYRFLDVSTDLSVDARTFARVNKFTKRSARSLAFLFFWKVSRDARGVECESAISRPALHTLPQRFRYDLSVATEGRAFSGQGQARGPASTRPHRTQVVLCGVSGLDLRPTCGTSHTLMCANNGAFQRC